MVIYLASHNVFNNQCAFPQRLGWLKNYFTQQYRHSTGIFNCFHSRSCYYNNSSLHNNLNKKITIIEKFLYTSSRKFTIPDQVYRHITEWLIVHTLTMSLTTATCENQTLNELFVSVYSASRLDFAQNP